MLRSSSPFETRAASRASSSGTESVFPIWYHLFCLYFDLQRFIVSRTPMTAPVKILHREVSEHECESGDHDSDCRHNRIPDNPDPQRNPTIQTSVIR